MFKVIKNQSKNILRLVVISDTHNKHRSLKLPQGDVLIHCGDFTDKGTSVEVQDFTKWFIDTPFKHKIVIAGNHELTFDTNEYYKRKGEHSNG